MASQRTAPLFLVTIILASTRAATPGCAPVAARGGPGTGNDELDEGALSTSLDKLDLDYLVDQNLNALYKSAFWARDVEGSAQRPIVTIFPIRNETSEHIDDQMTQLLSSIETSLVNSGEVRVVSRERQESMIREAGLQNRVEIDASTAARIGRQLGARYYFTGKLSAVDERMKKTRRVQYALFIQALDVETSEILFQNETARSKAVKR